MNFTPQNMISLLKSDNSIFDKPEEWYFSFEGIAAYNSLTSYADKTLHLFGFLLKKSGIALSQILQSNILFRGAVLLAAFVGRTSLEYAAYPDVISEKNPFINIMVGCAQEADNGAASWYTVCGSNLLALLHNEKDALLFFEREKNPYKRITYCKENETTETYLLERAIIGLFCCETKYKNSDTLFPPFGFNSAEKFEDEEDTNDD